MNVTYRVTEQDYVEACRLFLANETPLYRRYSRRAMPWIGAVVLVTHIAVLAIVPRPEMVLVIPGLLIGCYLLYCGFAIRRHFRRLFRKDRRFQHEFTAAISDEGIQIATPFSDSQMKWTTFVRFLESDQIFMVFIAEWLFLVFPKRAFVPAEAELFRAQLQQKICAAKTG